MKSQNKKTKEKKNSPASIDGYLKDIQVAIDYVESSYHPSWQNFYRTYRNKRVRIGYEGYSDAFIPETFTIIESLVSNIAGGKPKFQFLPTKEEQEQDADVLNQLIAYIWDCNHMDQKSQVWVREMLQYGTGVLFAAVDDYGMPCIKNIPIYDFLFDPTATCREDAQYMGFRYLANKNDLRNAKIIDPETGELKPMYNMANVDAQTGKTGTQTDKEIKDTLIGSTVTKDATVDQVEVIKLFYKDGKTVSIANRIAILEEGDSPYQQAEKTVKTQTIVNNQPVQQDKKIPAIKPFFPFALLRDYVDPSLLLGTGEIEVIMYRQETLNDVENMDLDNASYANNIMWQIDPQYVDLMPEISAAPGLVVPIPQGALQPIQRPTQTQDLEQKKQEIKQEMRRATAADEVIQGASQDQGRITATEVSTQLTQSHMRFSTKLNNLEAEGYAQLADIMLKICQIFVTQETAIRIVGDEGVNWKDFDPNEFSGDYEPHVKLDTTIKEMKMEQGQKLNQMYQLILNNPTIDQKEALRFILTNLGAEKDEIDKLLNTPPVTIPDPVPKVSINLRGDLNPQQAQTIGQEGMPKQEQPPMPDPSMMQGGIQPAGPTDMGLSAGPLPMPDNNGTINANELIPTGLTAQ